MADEPAPPGEGLAVKATRGALWGGLSFVTLQIFNLAVQLILINVLEAEEVGVVGLTTLYNSVIFLISDLGISNAVIQRKTLPDGYLDTALWINGVVGGVMFSLVALVISPLAAAWQGTPLLRPLMIVAAMPLIISPLGGIHRLLLQREGRFARLAAFETTIAVLIGSLSIVMALSGFGVWSLVTGPVINSFLSVLILWRLTPWRPSWRFSREHMRDLINFGGGMMGFNLVNYIGANADFLIISKRLGESVFAAYKVAFDWGTLTYNRIIPFVGKVLLPTFAQIQDDDARLRRGYTQLLTYASLLSFPIGAGVMAVAPEFVALALRKYPDIVTPLRLLCIAGMTYSVVTFTGAVITAKGRTDIMFKVSWVRLFGFGGAVLIGVRYGLVGVAVADVVYGLSTVWIFQGVAGRLIDMPLRDYLRIFIGPALTALCVGLGVTAWRWLMAWLGAGIVAIFASSVVVGGMIYVAAAWMFARSEISFFGATLRRVLVPYADLARARMKRPAQQ
ncbi:MAG TPA: lipopolysaccharide biosynthesis protein [Herpetosiphonaceae bacterium]